MNQTPTYNPYTPPPPPPPTNAPETQKKWLLIGGVGCLLILCLVAVIAGVIFALNFLGGKDAVANSMPPNVSTYVGFDLAQLTPEKIRRIVEPFRSFIEEVNPDAPTSSEDPFELLDRSIDEELGITFTDDILPWIGTSAGIGITELTSDDYGTVESGKAILAISARDTKKADAFLEKLRGIIEEESGSTFMQTEFNGTDLFTLIGQGNERVTLARSGKVVMISNDPTTLENAIVAQTEDSLIDQDWYKALDKELPDNTAISIYLDYSTLLDTYSNLQLEMLQPQLDSLGSVYALVGMQITDAGLQLDIIASYDPDSISDQQMELFKTYTEEVKIDEILPENILMMVNGRKIGQSIEMLTSQLGDESFDESMQLLEEEIGFDPIQDLANYLDGEYSIVLTSATDGLIAANMNLNLGMIALAETNNQEEIANTIEKFNARATDMLGTQPNRTNEAGFDLYEIVDPTNGAAFISYGTGSDYMVVGTSSNLIGSLFPDDSLSENASYRDIWDAFSGEPSQVFYIDVNRTLDTLISFGESMGDDEIMLAIDAMRPVETIAGGYLKTNQDNTIHFSMIIFLTPVE
jgi:hypothetical protein